MLGPALERRGEWQFGTAAPAPLTAVAVAVAEALASIRLGFAEVVARYSSALVLGQCIHAFHSWAVAFVVARTWE